MVSWYTKYTFWKQRCIFNYGSDIHSMTALNSPIAEDSISYKHHSTNKISTGQEKDLKCKALVLALTTVDTQNCNWTRVTLQFEDVQEVQACISTEQGIAPCLGHSLQISARNLRGLTVATFPTHPTRFFPSFVSVYFSLLSRAGINRGPAGLRGRRKTPPLRTVVPQGKREHPP